MKIVRALNKVFRSRINLAVAVFITVFAFVVSVWFVNFRFIWDLMLNNSIGFVDKINILISLIISISTSFTSLSALSTIIISVLLGVNTAMVFYIYRNRVTTSKKGIMASISGFVGGILGLGCASCGAFLLGPLLSLVGAGWIISLLPYKGAEIGFVSIAIFLFAIFVFAKRIEDPKVCEVKF